MNPPLLIGHRGASKEAPENTLASICRAIELQVDWIELDVQLTKDGVPVVFHDETLKRVCKDKRHIAGVTLAELRALDAGAWFHPSFRGLRVPALEEVLALSFSKTGLMLELKSYPSTHRLLVDKVAKLLPHRQKGALVVGSFDAALTEKLLCKAACPVIGIAETLHEWEAHRALGIRHFALHEKLFRPGRSCTPRQEETLWAWTVDSLARSRALCRGQAHGIITNDPRKLASALRQKSVRAA